MKTITPSNKTAIKSKILKCLVILYVVVACLVLTSLPVYANPNDNVKVDITKLTKIANTINKAKSGSDEQITAAYAFCQLTMGPASMPIVVNGQIKCRSIGHASRMINK